MNFTIFNELPCPSRWGSVLKSLFLLCALVTGNAGVRAETYKLTQVTSVEAGCLYVFEQTYTDDDGTVASYVMINDVYSNALKTTTSYKTSGLSGTEKYVWTLETASGGFYMKNVSLNSNQYLNNPTKDSGNVSFGSKKTVWAFNFQDDNTVLIRNTSYNDRFLGMNKGHYYKIYKESTYKYAIKVYKLEEVPPVPVAIGSAGIATFCSEEALDFTDVDAISVYTAKVEANIVKLHQIHKVPAGTGVILMNALGRENGAVASVDVPVLTGSADDVSDNELVGVTTRTLVAKTGGAGFNYILQSDGNGGIVFNMAIEGGATMPAGKAYLSTTVDASAARLSLALADETEGISAALNNKGMMNNVVYDLQGRRVKESSNANCHSQLRIVNGKKMMVKQ